MKFRNDIQILRAFAVTLVVLYHLEVPFFSKGFLGVDIFFVISGFLMAVLYKEGQPVEFFKRRVRRLLPPYAVVLISTMLFGMFFLFPGELTQVNEHAMYSVFFIENFGAWSETAYFSSSGFKPLLHLWTLGAEAQYYLFIPLILWIFRKHKLSTLALALGSFAICTMMLYVSPKTSFFMMPLRAWEFLIGTMAGLYLTNRGAVRSSAYSWLGTVGVIALVFIQLFPVNGLKLNFIFGHPGLAALLTCIATMTVIAFGLPNRVIDSYLAKPFIYIGKISYSIYLVHFPIIVLYFYKPFEGTILSSGNSRDTLILLALITTFSLLSYYLVEKRTLKLNQGILASVAAAVVFMLIAVNGIVVNKKFDPGELGYLMAFQDKAPYRCGKIIRITDPQEKVCLLNNTLTHDKSVLLVGNSHADAIKEAFTQVADLYGYNTYLTIENNPLELGGMGVDKLIDEAISKNINTIVTHNSPDQIKEETYLNLQHSSAEKGITFIAIAPVPVYPELIPKSIHYAYQDGQSLLSLQTRKDSLPSGYSDLRSLRKISDEEPDNFSYYEPVDYLCHDGCGVMGKDGRAWYHDGSHLTLTGALQLTPLFEELFSNLSSEKRIGNEVTNTIVSSHN